MILSFYDWYADLPPASPQAFGDQTDVPESGDWWNSSYLVIWGTNLPTTRTPDAHFMVESRYRGQKVVVVSPDYAEHTKFADDWLAAEPGSDGALAMAMGHVILKEFYVDRETPYFRDYARRFTDLPLLVTLREREDGYVADRLLRAATSTDRTPELEHADWKTVVLDERTGRPAVPNGSVGHRYAASDEGSWNLRLEGIEPALTLIDRATERVAVDLPRFDIGDGRGRRDRPPRRAGDPGRRAARDDGARPRARPVRRGAAWASWRLAVRLRRRAARPARRRGRSRSPAWTGISRRGWRGSSRATPS